MDTDIGLHNISINITYQEYGRTVFNNKNYFIINVLPDCCSLFNAINLYSLANISFTSIPTLMLINLPTIQYDPNPICNYSLANYGISFISGSSIPLSIYVNSTNLTMQISANFNATNQNYNYGFLVSLVPPSAFNCSQLANFSFTVQI